MLDELVVHNLAVLSEARLEPGTGFTVITGETGTGKTLLVGALDILRGADLRTDAIGAAGDEAIVEARFVHGGEERILARRRTRSGRTRSYLDGAMASAQELEDTLDGLVDIVAQHDHLSVGRPAEAVRMLDAALGADGAGVIEAYEEAWADLVDLERQAAELGGDHRALARERDFLAREAEEIEAAAFTDDEVEILKARADLLRNGHQLLESLDGAHADLSEAEDRLGGALEAVRRAARLAPSFAPLAEALGTSTIELAERRSELSAALGAISLDPMELESTERRLAQFGDLRRKFGETASAIAEHGRKAGERAAALDVLLTRAGTLDEVRSRIAGNVAEAGVRLTAARREAAARLAASASDHLRELGFRDPVVEFGFEALAAPSPSGIDRPVLRFASDATVAPGPVGRVASGGELSRLVLALRLAGGVGSAPVTAFDEIDAGVGGATALALGEKLASLASATQVLCVTHLPQVAAFGETHFVVERVPGGVRVRRVEGASRLAELTRMLSGMEQSDAGRSHAEELLRFAEERRHGADEV